MSVLEKIGNFFGKFMALIILAVAALALFVPQAVIKAQAASITVNDALEQGREIYAVPGRLTDGLSAGCNRLILEGAGSALHPDDILKALGLLCEEPLSARAFKAEDGQRKTRYFKLTQKEKLVFCCLDLYPRSVDEIVHTCRLSVSDVLEQLMSLCLKGAARECARSNYIRLV